MKVDIKFFGMLEEAVMKSEEIMEFENCDKISLHDIHEIIKNKNPKLKQYNYKIAVNHKITSEDIIINNNTEIALLPPFAGG